MVCWRQTMAIDTCTRFCFDLEGIHWSLALFTCRRMNIATSASLAYFELLGSILSKYMCLITYINFWPIASLLSLLPRSKSVQYRYILLFVIYTFFSLSFYGLNLDTLGLSELRLNCIFTCCRRWIIVLSSVWKACMGSGLGRTREAGVSTYCGSNRASTLYIKALCRFSIGKRKSTAQVQIEYRCKSWYFALFLSTFQHASSL